MDENIEKKFNEEILDYSDKNIINEEKNSKDDIEIERNKHEKEYNEENFFKFLLIHRKKLKKIQKERLKLEIIQKKFFKLKKIHDFISKDLETKITEKKYLENEYIYFCYVLYEYQKKKFENSFKIFSDLLYFISFENLKYLKLCKYFFYKDYNRSFNEDS
jgi:hypothetical protein